MTVGGQNTGITRIWKLGSREAFEQCCQMKAAASKAFCQAAVASSFMPLKPFQLKVCSVRKQARSLQWQMLAFKSVQQLRGCFLTESLRWFRECSGRRRWLDFQLPVYKCILEYGIGKGWWCEPGAYLIPLSTSKTSVVYLLQPMNRNTLNLDYFFLFWPDFQKLPSPKRWKPDYKLFGLAREMPDVV